MVKNTLKILIIAPVILSMGITKSVEAAESILQNNLSSVTKNGQNLSLLNPNNVKKERTVTTEHRIIVEQVPKNKGALGVIKRGALFELGRCLPGLIFFAAIVVILGAGAIVSKARK